MEKVFISRSIKIKTRLWLLKCYVWFTLLNGCESWTISKLLQKTLEAIEMWFLRRMRKISWVEKLSNQTVLNRAGASKQLINTIYTRQVCFLGHVLRKECFEELAVCGKIEDKRARGRQRLTFLQWIQRMSNMTPLEVIRCCCKDRKEHLVIANVSI